VDEPVDRARLASLGESLRDLGLELTREVMRRRHRGVGAEGVRVETDRDLEVVGSAVREVLEEAAEVGGEAQRPEHVRIVGVGRRESPGERALGPRVELEHEELHRGARALARRREEPGERLLRDLVRAGERLEERARGLALLGDAPGLARELSQDSRVERERREPRVALSRDRLARRLEPGKEGEGQVLGRLRAGRDRELKHPQGG